MTLTSSQRYVKTSFRSQDTSKRVLSDAPSIVERDRQSPDFPVMLKMPVLKFNMLYICAVNLLRKMAQWNGKYKIFFDEEELKSLQLCSESLDLQNVCQDFSEDLQRKSVCKETCSSSYPQGFNVHAAEFWPRQSTGSDETHTSSRPITSARGQHTDLPVSYAAFDYIKSPVSQVKEAKLEKPLSRFSPLSVHRAGSSVLGQERVSVPLNTTRDTPTSVPVVPIDKVILSPRYFLADSRVTSDYSVHDTSDSNLLTRNQLETQTLKSVLSRTGERNHPLTTRIGHASYILPTVPVCGTRRSNLDTKTQAVHISSSLPTVCDTVCSQPRRDIKVLQPVMGASQQRLVRDRKDSSFSLSPSDYYTTSLQLPRVSHRTSSLQTARDTNVPQQERLPTIPMSVSANAENVRFRTPLSDCSRVAFGTGSGEPMVEIPTMPSPWLSPAAIDSKGT